MNTEEASLRAHALLAVIESAYAIEIVNIAEVIEAITEKTQDERQILTICTALNTWVALNAGVSGMVEMPLNIVQRIAEQVVKNDEAVSAQRSDATKI